jgi:hypothetical protein
MSSFRTRFCRHLNWQVSWGPSNPRRKLRLTLELSLDNLDNQPTVPDCMGGKGRPCLRERCSVEGKTVQFEQGGRPRKWPEPHID